MEVIESCVAAMGLAFFVRGSMPRTFYFTNGVAETTTKESRQMANSESYAVMKSNADHFFGQSQLKGVTISDTVTQIESSAFYNCTGLTEIVIPSSVTIIEGYAFNRCTGLIHITVPNSVTTIEWYAFSDCKSLTYIIYRGTKKEWNSIQKGKCWNSGTGSYTVLCSDGAIPER